MPERLALHGGAPVRTKSFPKWPIFGDEEETALLRVLRGERWGRYGGGEVERFEQAFARWVGAKHAIAVTNGTVALSVALLACGLDAGDEVILPAYTFLATASAIVEANAVPVFVDIHPDSYCIDPARIEEAITPRTRAIIPVHMGGQAADMEAILAIARRHNLMVIEDAAQAHGAEFRGRKVGSWGDFGCFSFQSSKNLNCGEGGCIVTNDDDRERTARSLHNCGRLPGGGSSFEHNLMGTNCRLAEFQGAILNCQLARLEEQTARRDANGRYLTELLSHIPGIRPLPRGVLGETRHAYHIFMFRYDAAAFGGVPRSQFLQALGAEGIPVSPGYSRPLYEQPVFTEKRFGPFTAASEGYEADLSILRARCPVAEKASKEEACWLYQALLLGTRDDMDEIASAVAKVYKYRDALRSSPSPRSGP